MTKWGNWILPLYHHVQECSWKSWKDQAILQGFGGNCLNTDPQDQDVLSFGWRMKDGYYDIQWFDGDAAPKIVDVVHQCEGRIFKIWIILRNCYQFYPIFQYLICTKAKFFQADNFQLKDWSLWNSATQEKKPLWKSFQNTWNELFDD